MENNFLKFYQHILLQHCPSATVLNDGQEQHLDLEFNCGYQFVVLAMPITIIITKNNFMRIIISTTADPHPFLSLLPIYYWNVTCSYCAFWEEYQYQPYYLPQNLADNNITVSIIICDIFTTAAIIKSFLRNNEILEITINLYLKQIDNFTVKL